MMQPLTHDRPRPWGALLLGAVLALGSLDACRREDPSTPGGSTPGTKPDGAAQRRADQVVREVVAAHYTRLEYSAAAAALQPLIDRTPPAVTDLVWKAQIQMRLFESEGATATIEKALALDPKDVGARYTFGRLRYQQGYPDEVFFEARDAFEAILATVPDDPASKLELARILSELEGESAAERVRGLLDDVLGLGIENGLRWFVTAAYLRSRHAYDYGTEEDVRKYEALYQELKVQGFEPSKDDELDQGTLARIAPPQPFGTFPAGPSQLPSYGAPSPILPEWSGALRLAVCDIQGDRRPDLVGIDGEGVILVLQGTTGWTFTRPLRGDVAAVCAFDLNQMRGGDTLDLAVLMRDGTLTVLEQSDEVGAPLSFVPSPVAVPALDFEGRDLAVVDFDHDGDLDLFAVGAGGARLLRNDGAGVRLQEVPGPPTPEGAPTKVMVEAPRGVWTDASEEASLPRTALTWCGIEDFDTDQDIDLVCGGPQSTHLLSSLRRGRFEDVARRALGGAVLPGRPALGDVDGDGRMDFVVAGAPAQLWRQGAGLSFTAESLGVEIPAEARLTLQDLDLDGAADLVFEAEGRFGRAILSVGLGSRKVVDLPALPSGSGPLVADELDAPTAAGPLGHELVRATPAGLMRVSPTAGLGNAVYVKFFGKKDNRQGVGAVLEGRAQSLYRRILLRGEPELVGLGPNTALDVLRVTWPNGVVQNRLGVERGVDITSPATGPWVQIEGLVGSCPFLYTWNGTTFTFISDVLGITPLGLPIGPDMLVPPDHDEYVLVRGEQLAPDERGDYVMQFTEELREVTYLDMARLDVVDHPAHVEVFPNERFTFPPFPPAHLHTLEGAIAPRLARGSDGGDWTAALAAEDGVHARNLVRLGAQFLGLAEPHWLELEFDPAAVANAPVLRLLFTGWFYWTDASVNMATARTPGLDFVPPIIEVPDGAGGWRPIGPPVGFPAGKTKSMLIDLTEHLVRDDPRVRIVSTLELYWDRIALAVCADDAPRRVTELAATGAKLWSRGFSRPIPSRAVDQPQRFDWDELDEEPRWNQHPGRYTRFGDVLPLLGEVDDRFVIMGSGDALELRFDGRGLPPLPEGWRRDFLVYLDGWAKDRDPNTVEALEVEPLPFHAMSGYPYRADEAFPDTELHRRWRAEWNTRPAFEWIVPLAPPRLREWLGEQ